jgi:hypothetical protein
MAHKLATWSDLVMLQDKDAEEKTVDSMNNGDELVGKKTRNHTFTIETINDICLRR